MHAAMDQIVVEKSSPAASRPLRCFCLCAPGCRLKVLGCVCHAAYVRSRKERVRMGVDSLALPGVTGRVKAAFNILPPLPLNGTRLVGTGTDSLPRKLTYTTDDIYE